jgi:hypothetical protein
MTDNVPLITLLGPPQQGGDKRATYDTLFDITGKTAVVAALHQG